MYQQKPGSIKKPLMLNKLVKEKFKFFKRYTRNLYYKLVFRVLKLIFFFVQKESSLTCYSGNDGGGAQLQRIMSTASLCNYLGLKFVFTPIREIDFNPNGIRKSTWIKEWNSLINFPDVYAKNDKHEFDQLSLSSALVHIVFKKGDYAISDAHNFADSHPDEYDKLISSLGLKMSKTSESDSLISKSLNKAILHYRMPIVGVEHKLYSFEKKREVSTDKFIDSVELIKTEQNINDDFIKVLLYNFKNTPTEILGRYSKVTFDDSTNAIDAIRLMSSAEVLLVSYSSMSYLAALFNQNIVYYYKDFWHSPKSYWKGI